LNWGWDGGDGDEMWNRKEDRTRHQWLMPVILATLEAEIRRIMIQSQTGQRVP
jgi:hypothetical protein